jgi:hypothetical protein
MATNIRGPGPLWDELLMAAAIFRATTPFQDRSLELVRLSTAIDAVHKLKYGPRDKPTALSPDATKATIVALSLLLGATLERSREAMRTEPERDQEIQRLREACAKAADQLETAITESVAYQLDEDVGTLDNALSFVTELRTLAEGSKPSAPAPIDMLLFCPSCGAQHVDVPEPEKGWTNPPHKSHLCHGCGSTWRPADVPTNGVQAVRTRGKADTWPGAEGSKP